MLIIQLFVSQAIGDSGQGFFNFIIFFVFQPRLREIVLKAGRRYCCCCCNRASRWWTQLHKKKSTNLDSGELVQPVNGTSTHPTATAPLDFSEYTLYV